MNFKINLLIVTVIFQASLSLVLSGATLMTGRSLSKQIRKHKLKKLLSSFYGGAVSITILIIASIILLVGQLEQIGVELNLTGLHHFDDEIWLYLMTALAIQSGLMIILAILRRKQINPWTPSAIKKFLVSRSEKTASTVEAFSLGLMSVLGNFLIIFLPLTVLSIGLLEQLKIYEIIVFALLSNIAILIIYLIVSLNVPISKIHKFILNNYRFFISVAILSMIIINLLIISHKLSQGSPL